MEQINDTKILAKPLEYTNKADLNKFRFIMIFLIIFEILNGLKFLNFSPDYTWAGLIIVAFFVWTVIEILYLYNKNLSLIPLFILPISVYLDASGDIFHLYSIISNYDKYLHFINSSIITWVIYLVLKDKLHQANFNNYLKSLILISMGSFFGVLYEIEEFLEDLFINHKQLRLGDGPDTAGDLLMDVIGSTVMVILIIFYLKQKKQNKEIKAYF